MGVPATIAELEARGTVYNKMRNIDLDPDKFC